jgi:hypothetical protein
VPNTSSLPAGSNRPRPCQGLGNKQHRVPALPKRHRWDGWYGWEVVPFSRPCWCIRRPGDEGRVWLAPEGSENIPTRARTGQKWPANFLDFFFWRRPFCGIFWGAGESEHKRRADGSIWKWKRWCALGLVTHWSVEAPYLRGGGQSQALNRRSCRRSCALLRFRFHA